MRNIQKTAECSLSLPDENTFTAVKKQPPVSAAETLPVEGITRLTEDLATLNPGQWLNDIVKFYIYLLQYVNVFQFFIFNSKGYLVSFGLLYLWSNQCTDCFSLTIVFSSS